ncbi:hypothetical protein [Riemerella anatipestifer]|uniref:hypothetical protein n=1 Tax=Riemerella anatipestifer TaxID=34085 RepID=UPI0023638565|nr:hypothetical protein [Riemerella anatipestifer]MDD1538637.1 hypothetical protein [Riemerella anatipestifer]
MQKINNDIYVVGGVNLPSAAIKFTGKDKNTPKHSSPKQKPSSSDSEDWCKWGDNNDYPRELMQKVSKVGAAVGGLEVLTSAHYGIGIRIFELFETDGDANFKEKIPSSIPEIYDFFDRTNFDLMLSDIIYDYEALGIAFPEFLLSPNGEEVISVMRHQASYCRFEKPKNGAIQNVIINTSWGETEFDSRDNIKVPCFSQNLSIEEIKRYCKEKGIRKFIVPIINSLIIEKVYPSVGWHSSFKSGWMDVVIAVPELKKMMFLNQFNFKYIIHIADDYFIHRYGLDEWTNFSSERREQLRIELINAIDENLKGSKGSGKSIISPYFRDKNTGELIKGIQIDEIKQTQANGEFLPDASAGNSEILFSMGVDPALLGAGVPGGKNLSGSGSDKREAWTILCARLPRKHIRTLYIFRLIQKWNGWNPDLVAKLPNINLTTLDKNPSGQKKITN